MSVDDPSPAGTAPLARAVRAAAQADARLAAAIDDCFLPDDDRLDDRARAALRTALRRMVDGVTGDLAARLDGPTAAAPVSGSDVLERLLSSGLLRDRELMREVIERVQLDLLGDALPLGPSGERPSLLVRLTDVADRGVAAAARELMAAESRAFGPADAHTELPAELQHRLVWWIAAVLREQRGAAAEQALADAALQALAQYDEGERAAAAATRLARAIDAQAHELAELLVEALATRYPTLFVAALAHAAGLGFDPVRTIVLAPDGEQLWPLLRLLGLDRATIAQLGLLLAEADPRRPSATLVTQLETVDALSPLDAAALLAPLRLHPDFLQAVRALAGAR